MKRERRVVQLGDPAHDRQAQTRPRLARAQHAMEALAQAVPSLADGINALLALCIAPDPVAQPAVSAALNALEG